MPSRVLGALARLMLLLSICLAASLPAALTSGAEARGTHSQSNRWAAAVAVPAPSPGDVSYGVIRVRTTRGSRLELPRRLAGQRTIFSSRIGGLAIRARSAQWRGLRASTHVYVVVSEVPGAGPSVRDVAMFVVRHDSRGGPATGQISFTIANARPVLGSFWVHGVDSRGFADVFKARNILSTALQNWSRYVAALRVANALKAAMHPVMPAVSEPAAASAAHRPLPGPWTGGQHADAEVLDIYHLLIGALHDPMAFADFKLGPAVPSFITSELGNPALAARWVAVTAQVPSVVPDQYAALAQEEKRFAHVVPPKIGHNQVAIADSGNSSSTGGQDVSSLPAVSIAIPGAPGSAADGLGGPAVGVVGVTFANGTEDFCNVSACSIRVPPNLSNQTATFSAFSCFAPDETVTGGGTADCQHNTTAFSSWSGCTDRGPPRAGWESFCDTTLSTDSNHPTTVTANFAPAFELDTDVTSADGGVTINPSGVSCYAGDENSFFPHCWDMFASGTQVTLTATPPSASDVASWSGCDQASGNTCTVTMNQSKNVTVGFVPITYPLSVTVNTNNASDTGSVTSDSGGIDCSVGQTCSASYSSNTVVTLTAHPNNGVFEVWSGCDSSTYTTCTVTMSQVKNVTATF